MLETCPPTDPAAPAWATPAPASAGEVGFVEPGFCVTDAQEWISEVNRNFFPFSLHPASTDNFHAGSTFKRSSIMSVGAVNVDAHVATVSRSNRQAAESGMTKLLWMIEGEADFEQDDWSWQVGSGQWVAYDIDRPYRFQSYERASFITMVCRRDALGLPTGICAKPTPRPIEDLSLMILQFARTALRTDVALGQRALNALSYGAQQCIIESLTHQDEPTSMRALQTRLVADAKRYIERHLHDPDLRADSIADALGVSRRTLYSAFAAMADTPARAIQQARLQQAQQVLLGRAPGSENITNLALSVGFNDAAHFSRIYRKMFGETPTSTRNKHPLAA